MKYNYFLEMASLFYLTILAIQFYKSEKIPNLSNKIFGFFLIDAAVDIGFNIISSILIENATTVPVFLNVLCCEIFFICQFSMTTLMLTYIMLLYGVFNKPRFIVKLVYGFLGLNFLMVLSNPITKCIFYFENNEYLHGPLFPYFMGLMLTNLASSVVVAFIRSKHHPDKNPVNFLFYVGSVILFIILQLFVPSVLLSGLSMALGSMVIFITTQNPKTNLDPLTKVFNRRAFTEYLNELIVRKHHYPMIVIDIRNTTTFNHIFGEDNGNIIIKSVATELRNFNTKNLVFKYGGDRFIMVVLDEKADLFEILEDFSLLFIEPITVGTLTLKINLSTLYFTRYNEINSAQDVLNAIDFGIDDLKHTGGTRITKEITSDIIARSKRHSYMERAITTNVINKTVECALQPVYDSPEKKCNYALLVAKIKSDNLGFVYPAEYSQIAERTNKLTTINHQAVLRLFKFLSKLSKEKKVPFKRIGLPLTASDCLNEHLASDYQKLFEYYEIDPNLFIFEISETDASISQNVLPKSMKTLRDMGVEFSCTNFGYGYGDLHIITQLPFSYAKLHFLVNDSLHNSFIAQTMKMLQELNIKTGISGVNSKALHDIAHSLGADFLEGTYLADQIDLNDIQFV